MNSYLKVKNPSTVGGIGYDIMPMSDYATSNLLTFFNRPGWESFINVPKGIKENVESLKKKWGLDTVHGVYDDMSHGGLGYILFLEKYINNTEKLDGIDNNKIVVRLSYGNAFDKWKNIAWDMLSFQRLHLSMLGTKFVMPENTDHLIRENVYFTIRWENSKFNNQTKESLNKPYARLNTRRISFSQAVKIVLKNEEYLPHVKDMQNFEILEESPVLMQEKFGELYSHHYIHTIVDGAPQLGYEHVLKALSKYGDVSIDDIIMLEKSKPKKGLEYFFNKAVPAMENYIQGKHK